MNVIFYIAKFGNYLDKAISWRTGGPYSHVELQFSDRTCFSSSPRDGGTRFANIDDVSCHWMTVRTKCDFHTENDIKNWCETQLGKPYDWFGVMGLGVDLNIERKNKWFCSEICAAALIKFNIYPIQSTDISPNKLFKCIIPG